MEGNELWRAIEVGDGDVNELGFGGRTVGGGEGDVIGAGLSEAGRPFKDATGAIEADAGREGSRGIGDGIPVEICGFELYAQLLAFCGGEASDGFEAWREVGGANGKGDLLAG